MRIFISWSGAKSKDAALLLRAWLPSVIQSLDTPWVSDFDIESGANWSATIGEELTKARFGIICVTRQNQNRSWLNFEAGAISKLVGGAVPLLVDFAKPEDLSGGPMSQLQVRMPNMDGISKLMSDINHRLDKPLESTVLADAIDLWFPQLEGKLGEILADNSYGTVAPKRGVEDKVDEVLKLLRSNQGQLEIDAIERTFDKYGRPSTTNYRNTRQTISVRLPPETMALIDALAQAGGINKTTTIENAVRLLAESTAISPFHNADGTTAFPDLNRDLETGSKKFSDS